MKKGKLYFYIVGAVTGLCNGLFGSGGGIAAVPMLQKGGVDVKNSHATSLALTLPLSVISAFFTPMTKASDGGTHCRLFLSDLRERCWAAYL